ncbi:MAG: class III poly(R)-hydroxyalkanoic acid synthase subunit PhaC [Magnetococcales bacterium]|nr:class III poly(R)-hydroxyalkanoic acid synthase subunit PhaC [Magnetococcales bacterium]
MLPFSISPEKAAQEVADLNRKFINGLPSLGEVGEVEVGCSEREAIYQEDKMVLYRFKPRVENPHRVPVLVVYALVNRPYMADLQEDRSMIRGLLDQGLDVYLIDWGYPDRSDKFINLDDYINGYIHRSVEAICERHGLFRINVLGICQGGSFSLCYSAMHPERVRNLVVTVTPVDFQTPDNLLSHWAQKLDVDLMVDAMGNIPGDLLNVTFASMRSAPSTGKKYLDMIDILEDKKKLTNFLRMEKWVADSPDQAGEAFCQFIKDFYQKNGLVNGGIKIGDKTVDLKNLTMPVLNVYATKDHLVPPAASLALKNLVGSEDYSELPFSGGHIGLYVSSRAQKEVPPGIADWIKKRG